MSAMQHNNDDMDKLFREAAENYPLNTNSSNWDAVASRLDKDERKPAGYFQFANGYRKYILLALIIIIPMATWLMMKDNDAATTKPANATSTEKIQQPTIATEQATTENKTSNEIAVRPNADVPATVNAVASVPSQNKRSPVSFSDLISAKTKTVNTNQQKEELTSQLSTQSTIASVVPVTKENTSTGNNIKTEEQPINNITENKIAEKAVTAGTKAETTNATPAESKTEKKPAVTEKQKRFSLTLLGGVDLSNVKMQRPSKVGTTIGVLAGYSITKHFSVETGVLLSTKKYYTAAKYFNTAKMYNPAYVKWKTIEGECKMTEIPIYVRYNFTAKKKDQWFASTGVSSYLMNKEDYDYTYDFYNQPRKGSVSYKKSGNYWNSVLQVSGGVERKIGKQSSIRIEPYLRVPLKVVGYGDLPIASGGLNVGFRKNLF
jgi:hypothetical protein